MPEKERSGTKVSAVLIHEAANLPEENFVTRAAIEELLWLVKVTDPLNWKLKIWQLTSVSLSHCSLVELGWDISQGMQRQKSQRNSQSCIQWHFSLLQSSRMFHWTFMNSDHFSSPFYCSLVSLTEDYLNFPTSRKHFRYSQWIYRKE